MPSERETAMGVGAIKEEHGTIGDGDLSGGTGVDDVDASGASGTHSGSMGQMLHGSVVSAALANMHIKRDFDGNIVPVESKVVTEAVMREGTFENGTPVTYQTSTDGSRVLSLTKRSNAKNLGATGEVGCGTATSKTHPSAKSA